MQIRKVESTTGKILFSILFVIQISILNYVTCVAVLIRKFLESYYPGGGYQAILWMVN